MTRRGLMFRICLALTIYAVAIAVGCDLRFRYPKREDLHYVLYKDLVPLVVAIPAVWLAYCFQRRASTLQQLRAAWAEVVTASQGAIRYTHLSRPPLEAHRAILEGLDGAIEATRGLFRPGRAGPTSSLAAIRDELEALGSGDSVTTLRAEASRSAILAHWDVASGRLLQEFDRVPSIAPRTARHRPYDAGDDSRARLTALLVDR
jgi:hypothetical protein